MTRKELDKIIAIISIHTEHEGGYCDTGSDMEWYCRSKCTQMALDRLDKAWELSKQKHLT